MWFFILGPIVLFGLLYLVYLAISKGLLGETWDEILEKIILMAVVTTVLYFTYLFTGNNLFIKLIPVLLVLIFFYNAAASFYRRTKAKYALKYGKRSTEEGWICPKCGARNGSMDLECWKCKTKL